MIGTKNYIGGLIGLINSPSTEAQITNCISYSSVNSQSTSSGSFIGGILNTADGVNFTNISITNCQSIISHKNIIGAVIFTGQIITDYDLSPWLSEISEVEIFDIFTGLQVGVHGNASSRISFNTNFEMDILDFDILSDDSLNNLDNFLNTLSEKSTMLGSVSNRLESVLDEILIQHDNLVSSRSTIRDADIAKVSSSYIKQQILQQASATLLSSAQNIQAQNVLGLLQSLS